MLTLEKYSGSSMGNLPIGQGVSVTPMQMASAYAAIANGGILRPARIVRAVDGKRDARAEGPARHLAEDAPRAARACSRACSPRAAPASEAKVPGYELAGKTGTANKVDEETGLYSESALHRLVRRLRAGRQPAAARLGDGRRAEGRDLRRRGRGARVPADHVVRAELPPHPAGVACTGDAPGGRPRRPGRPAGRDRRPGLRQPPGRAGDAVLLRPRLHARRARLRARRGRARRRRAGRRPPARRSASPRSSSTTCAPRWRPPPRGSTATRPRRCAMVGVTGTNGKTTTCFLVRELLEAGGDPDRPARHGHVVRRRRGAPDGAHDARGDRPAAHVRRDARRRRRARARWRSPRTRSSCGRADAIHWDVAVFTNLTQDHLDFHPTMEDYFLAKRRLFEAGPAR